MKLHQATMHAHQRPARGAALLAAATLALAACGGGGGGGAGELPVNGAVTCPALPAGSSDVALDGVSVGNLAADKSWLAAMMASDYLWPLEIPYADPAAPQFSDVSQPWDSLSNYFAALLTRATDARGAPKDRFSFTYPTQAWQKLADQGVETGYGAQWSLASPTPPRQVQVAYVLPGSPAASAGLRRGDRVLAVNGVSTDVNTQAGVAQLVGALYPQSGCSTTFELSREGMAAAPVVLQAGDVLKTATLAPRVIDTGNGRKVGYVAFLEHFGDAEARITEALAQFQQARVNDLVLDLRYNGGGYLYIASQVAYMVAGAGTVRSRDFERLQYNAGRAAESAASAMPFLGTACLPDGNGYCTSDAALPQIGLSRLYVLTSESTCSASESIINGLRGVDVEVHLVGGSTCGKPYGFTAKERSGISYFPIEFSGVNHKGQGDYVNGFEPTCRADDDLGYELGDTREAMLATALAHQSLGRCPAAVVGRSATVSGSRRWAGAVGTRPAGLDIGLRSPQTERILSGREARGAVR